MARTRKTQRKKSEEAAVIMSSPEPRLYKFPEAAELLEMSVNALKAKIRDRQIAVTFVGNPAHRNNPRAKGKRISADEIRRFIMMNQGHTPAA